MIHKPRFGGAFLFARLQPPAARRVRMADEAPNGSGQCKERNMRKYTGFCRQVDDQGTIYISSVLARSPGEASKLLLEECAEAWGVDEDHITVIGLAAGDVEIIGWDDEPGSAGLTPDSAFASEQTGLPLAPPGLTQSEHDAALIDGWCISNDPEGAYVIMRDDAAGKFASDLECLGHVYKRAREGSDLHRKAIDYTVRAGAIGSELVASSDAGSTGWITANSLLQRFDRLFGDAVERDEEIGGADAVEAVSELAPLVRTYLTSAAVAPEAVHRLQLTFVDFGKGPVAQFRLSLCDMHFFCDLTNNRQIRLASALARSHGIEMEIHPGLKDRVDNAISL